MFLELRNAAYAANMEIPYNKLAVGTWGNVSVLDSIRDVFAIKPSGVSYDDLVADDIVIVDFNGTVVDGSLKPSTDTRTHATLYRAFRGVRSIVHTHSTFAVAWAQAILPIPILGTTHADHTIDDIPCTPPMEDTRIEFDYEEETGNQIITHFAKLGLDPMVAKMILVGSHGPFAWGVTPEEAIYNVIALEEIARMAYLTRMINPSAPKLNEALRKKHFHRKHGKDAYYGQ